jgi:hypothetical protein
VSSAEEQDEIEMSERKKNHLQYIDKNIGWCLTFVGVYIRVYTSRVRDMSAVQLM